MAITVLQLMARVGIDTKEAEAGLAAVSGAGKAMSGGMVLAAGLVGAAVVGIGAASIKMAGDFQAGVTTLQTGAGELPNNMRLVSNGILDVARATGMSTQQLISGMFMIESAGHRGGDALNVLKIAAEGAKVGNADLGTTADALTTILKDFPSVTGGATGAMNILIQTVASGKTHMQDLAGALSGVLPTAASAGVGLNSVMAAEAAMTAQGTPAANAATYLRQLIISLSAPSKQSAAMLASIGLTTKQVSDEMHKSLPLALQDIEDHLVKKFPVGSAGYVAAMKDIAGGSRQMQGILQLTGAHLSEFTDDFKHLSAQARGSSRDVQGWNLVQGNLNFQASRAKEVFETMMISLGQHLLPVATKFFAFLADDLIPVLSNFVSWLTSSSASSTAFKIVLVAVGGAIMAVLVTAFVSWAAAAATALVATIALNLPLLAIGAAIALVIGVVILAVTHWKQITTALGHFRDMVMGPVHGAIKDMGAGLGALGSIAAGVWNGIKGGINGVIDSIDGFIRGVDRIHVSLPGGVDIGFNIPLIPHLAAGGTATRAGLAMVGERGPEALMMPRGASVLPLPALSRAASAAAGAAEHTQTIIVQFDGRVVASSVVRHLPREVRLVTGRRDF